MSKTKDLNIDLKHIDTVTDLIGNMIKIGFTTLTETVKDPEGDFDRTISEGWLLINRITNQWGPIDRKSVV